MVPLFSFPVGNNMTQDTAKFLLALLHTQQLAVGASDFDESLEKVLRARKELQEIIDNE